VKPADLLRVLIVDDHEGYRNELRQILDGEPDIQVVADVSNGGEAVRRVHQLRPDALDLVLMDIDMPLMDGIEATEHIVTTDPALPVIILTVSSRDRDLFAGISSGAIGFLNKSLSPGALVRTLRDYRRTGSLPMSRVAAGKVLVYLQRHSALAADTTATAVSKLSSRERQILKRIADGARDREIASDLVVGESTIKTHVRHILRKLGARNRAEAVARLRSGEPA
jgi:DNA-binding NarL/FixJ family response regulator